jgi:hypothetical protein
MLVSSHMATMWGVGGPQLESSEEELRSVLRST